MNENRAQTYPFVVLLGGAPFCVAETEREAIDDALCLKQQCGERLVSIRNERLGCTVVVPDGRGAVEMARSGLTARIS